MYGGDIWVKAKQGEVNNFPFQINSIPMLEPTKPATSLETRSEASDGGLEEETEETPAPDQPSAVEPEHKTGEAVEGPASKDPPKRNKDFQESHQ